MKKSELANKNDLGSKKRTASQAVGKISKTVGLVVAVVIFSSVAILTALVVLSSVGANRASMTEYDNLREFAEQIDASDDGFELTSLGSLDIEMRQINPDFVAWIRVDGTRIDYPVVRGTDNLTYLTTSFQGNQNRNGTLFMDYRNIQSIPDIPHIIIYGHNNEQGGMFSDLHRFLSDGFLNQNDTISLQVDDEILEFKVFSARLTDITDYAYFLNFDYTRAFSRFADRVEAPLRATQIITLSTCTNCNNNNARLVVQGYR